MADIDPNSWHYKLNMFFDHVSERKILDKNTCSYVRLTLGSILLSVLGVGLVIGALIVVCSWLYITFAPLLGMSHIDITGAIVLSISWAVFSFVAILFVRENRDLFEDHDRTLFSFSERKVAKTDGLFVQWLKDKHGKICTQNRIIEDGWDKD